MSVCPLDLEIGEKEVLEMVLYLHHTTLLGSGVVTLEQVAELVEIY